MFLEHVNMTVSNLDRSIEFYRNLFEFQVRWRGYGRDGQPAAHVGNDRFYVALFETRNAPSPQRDYDQAGMNHFGWVVEDLDDMKRRLQQLGITPHSEQDYEPGRRLYFLDPDQVEVELVQYD